MTGRLISVGCSWCHAIVATDDPAWPSCPECGHRADRARLFCDCSSCRHGRSVGIVPLDLVDAMVRLDVRVLPPDAIAFLRECGIDPADFGIAEEEGGDQGDGLGTTDQLGPGGSA